MNKKIVVKENQTMLLPFLWLGEDTELSYTISLSGKGAAIKLIGLLVGKGTSTVKLTIRVTHEAEDTKSDVVIKSALRDSSQVNFDGLIKIEPGAKGTNAWLAAHLLLLSPLARGIAVPNLEILENDIKAGHATTVGRVNELELFYLMSRGIPKEQAQRLIVDGFFESLMSQFPSGLQKKARSEIAVL